MTLLHPVRQLVRQQLLPARAGWAVLTLAEVDVAAGGEGAGAELLTELVGLGVGMHAHAAEVGAEARLHECACRFGQRAAAAASCRDAPFDRRAGVEAAGMRPPHAVGLKPSATRYEACRRRLGD